MTDELVKKALAVKSAAELLALAEKNDSMPSREGAEDTFGQIPESRGE